MVRWTLMVLLNGRGSLPMNGSSMLGRFDLSFWNNFVTMTHFWSMVLLTELGSHSCIGASLSNWFDLWLMVLLPDDGSLWYDGATSVPRFVPLLGYGFGRVTHFGVMVLLASSGSLFVTGTTQTKGFTFLHWCCSTEKVRLNTLVQLHRDGSLLINGTYFHT
jgi:hypothetical protein